MKKLRIYFLGGIFIVVILVSTIYISLLFYIATVAEKDTTLKSDAILVLGARSYIDGRYNPCLEARVHQAVSLYETGYASKIIATGGNDREDNVNEAETIKKIASEKGVPENVILEEKEATSTFENFSLSKKLAKENNIDSVIIVTEPFHIARASLVAKKLGYTFTVSPAVTSPCWKDKKYFSKYFLKEPIAILMYKLHNKL